MFIAPALLAGSSRDRKRSGVTKADEALILESGDRNKQRTSDPILRDGDKCVEEPRSAEGRRRDQRELVWRAPGGEGGLDSKGAIRVPPP